MTTPSPRTALVLEDLPEVSEWLTQTLYELFPDIHVESADRLSAAAQLLSTSAAFDLALIDLALPDGNGTDVIRQIAATRPECTIIVTTLFADDGYLFPALRAGANGYLLKDQPREKFAAALRGILEGEPPLSPAIAHRLLRMFNDPRQPDDGGLLSPREREVLTLTAKGYPLPEIAQQLAVSRHTAADHLKTIYRKLKINSRAEAALEAARLGLIQSAY